MTKLLCQGGNIAIIPNMVVIPRYLCLTILILLLQGCPSKEETGGNKGFHVPDIGEEASIVTLTIINEGDITIDNLKGKVVVLNFWATWCPPCKKEMPLLEATYNKYKEKGLIVLGVNYNEDSETITKFVKEMGITFPIALDRDFKVTKAYGVLALPTTFFIDRNGIIRDRFRGEITEEVLSSKVLPLLTEQAN